MNEQMKLSLYQQHREKWKQGCGARICQTARNVVFARGKIPSDVVFIGEAPGKSENLLGKPFIGVSGKLLDHIVSEALPSSYNLRVSFYNLVGCIPLEEGGDKEEPPDDDCVIQCGPKLKEFIGIAKPKLLVCVGKLSKDWLDPTYKHSIKLKSEDGSNIPRVHITHPAAILKANIAQRELNIRRCIITIRNAVTQYALS